MSSAPLVCTLTLKNDRPQPSLIPGLSCLRFDAGIDIRGLPQVARSSALVFLGRNAKVQRPQRLKNRGFGTIDAYTHLLWAAKVWLDQTFACCGLGVPKAT